MKNGLVLVAAGFLLLPCLPAVAQNLRASCGPENRRLSVKIVKGAAPPIHPAAGKAMVVFVNDACWSCGTVNIGFDGEWTGANRGFTWFSLNVAPGEKHVCAYLKTFAMPLRDTLRLTELNAEAGKTYYFETWLTESQGLQLWPVSADEGNFLISESKPATWQPKGH